jgi:hypothetical protein
MNFLKFSIVTTSSCLVATLSCCSTAFLKQAFHALLSTTGLTWSAIKSLVVTIENFSHSPLPLSVTLPYFQVVRMSHNVCVSSVVRFRSRVLSPTPNVERRYKLWATRHRTIEETFCWVLGRVNRYLSFATCLKSTVAFCWRVRVQFKWTLVLK